MEVPRLLVVWKRPNNTIYHKFVKGYYNDYYIGFKNSFDHIIIYITKVYVDSCNKSTYRFDFPFHSK